MDAFFVISTLIKIVVITFLLLLPMIAYAVYAERRVSAIIQDRVGPNRVGFAGLLQPIADGLKFLLKEEFTPAHVRKGFFILAPILTMAPALITTPSSIIKPLYNVVLGCIAGKNLKLGASLLTLSFILLLVQLSPIAITPPITFLTDINSGISCSFPIT